MNALPIADCRLPINRQMPEALRPSIGNRQSKIANERSAFTLIELTLSAALIAMLALTFYTALSTGFRARTTAREQMHAVREATIAMELVQQDLQSVPPPRGVLAGPFVGYAMGASGAEADSLSFHALGFDPDRPDSPHSEGMRRIEIVLRNDLDPPTLVRRVQRNLLAPVQPAPVEEPLARNVHAFAVRYFNGYAWLQEWDSTLREDMLPLAVELTIELDRPSPSDRTRRYRMTQIVPLSCGRASESEEDLGVLLE